MELGRMTELKCAGSVEMQYEVSVLPSLYRNAKMLPSVLRCRSICDSEEGGMDRAAASRRASSTKGMSTTPSQSARLPSRSTAKSMG